MSDEKSKAPHELREQNLREAKEATENKQLPKRVRDLFKKFLEGKPETLSDSDFDKAVETVLKEAEAIMRELHAVALLDVPKMAKDQGLID